MNSEQFYDIFKVVITVIIIVVIGLGLYGGIKSSYQTQTTIYQNQNARYIKNATN